MKTITLMRHAKSSWEDARLSDRSRPLIQKGIDKTHKVIERLKKEGFSPDFILTSPAVRALETARLMAQAFEIESEYFREEPRIYIADQDGFYDICFDLPESCSHVLIIGHNPAISLFAHKFAELQINYLPTSGMASFEFEAENWEALPVSTHRMKFLLFPKMIP